MKYLKQIAYVLLLIGGINWGVYGVSGYDVVDVLLGNIPMIANIVYVLVGLSAVYILLQRYSMCSCSQGCACSHSTCACDTKSPIEEKKD
jgi:uncharacterized membrane protein YuzA (DUF378 family)